MLWEALMIVSGPWILPEAVFPDVLGLGFSVYFHHPVLIETALLKPPDPAAHPAFSVIDFHFYCLHLALGVPNLSLIHI